MTLVWRVFFSVLVLFVTYLSLTPNPSAAGGGVALTRWLAVILFANEDLHDKIAHFIAYGTLAFVYAQTALKPFGRPVYGIVWLAIFGLAMELAQGMTTYRELSGRDLLANWAGLAVGYPAGKAAAIMVQRYLGRFLGRHTGQRV